MNETIKKMADDYKILKEKQLDRMDNLEILIAEAENTLYDLQAQFDILEDNEHAARRDIVYAVMQEKNENYLELKYPEFEQLFFECEDELFSYLYSEKNKI